jgi:putative glutamine amidotransferase
VSGSAAEYPTPLIGVTGRRFPADASRPAEPTVLAGIEVDVFFQPYARRLVDAGAAVVFLPRESAPDVLLGALDGILLSGGQDVHPAHYGGAVTAETTELDPAQDEFDLALARAAVDMGIPLLGTCRGHEALNVALGGTLRDHGLPRHNVRSRPASHRAHPVRFTDGSLMHRLYGSTGNVNSLHHQVIDRLAPSMRATGWADDGVVEAIEMPDHPVVGVQWHPEFHTGGDPILTWLVDAARGRRLTRHGRGEVGNDGGRRDAESKEIR